MESGNNNNEKGGLVQGGKEKKKEKKYYGKFLILIIFIVLSIEYYQYVFEVMIKYMTPKNFNLILTLLIIFHILVLLLLMAFISTMVTNPGEIPLYWGFYIGDDDYKRKRYCLICNAFKPERSHHCSVCNICVLNMDHHCPWVDNCIGFYNRKHFMQLLFFVVILTIYVDISEIYFIFDMCVKLFKKHIKYSELFHIGLVVISYTAVFVFSIIITMFLKFHIKLVINNSTTIESLDTEHKKDNEKFDLGCKQNWEQVFGVEPLFWFLPFPTKRGRPEGDGLTWKTKDDPLKDSGIKVNDSNIRNFGSNNNYETNLNSIAAGLSQGTK
jgi:palmitoyltransferase